MSDLDELTLDELIDEFDFLGNWEDQCRYLIELGEQLPDLSEAEKNEVNRVLGCQARVWLVADTPQPSSDPRIHFRAKSDARLVDGLIVVLSLLFDGKPASEILKTDFKKALTKLGLESHLVPQRRNGLFAMVERVRTIAKASLGKPANDQTDYDSKLPAQPQIHSSTPFHSSTPSTDEPRSAQVAVLDRTSKPSHFEVARHLPSFDVDEFRAHFPILAQSTPSGKPITFLDSAASSQKPQCVIDRETEVYETFYANAYRGVYRFGDRISKELELAREACRRLIGAPSTEEIVFTSGTTMGINLIANAWGRKFLQPGDEIVVSLLEHHANIVPWQWISKQTGAVVKFLPLLPNGTLDPAAFDSVIGPRTKIVSVTALSNVLGTVPPIAELSRKAHSVGALLMVDAAQSIPHSRIDVVANLVDFLVFSGHKLYGPSGIGVLYGKREHLEAMDPFLCGGHMISEVTTGGFQTSPIPAKFEAGTIPIAQAIALRTAIEFVESYGYEAIHGHEQSLLRQAWDQLIRIPGIQLYGPTDGERGAIISFTLQGASAQDVASLLDLHGVCVRHGHHCTMPLHEWLGVPATVRASFAGYNTVSDIERLVAALLDVRKTLKLA